ncbi:MAG: hypothetical protein HY466_04160 [Deltaproteobacteria bacterium]|nr:hypothetical protein [Deltaproteobacteria bacterium]
MFLLPMGFLLGGCFPEGAGNYETYYSRGEEITKIYFEFDAVLEDGFRNFEEVNGVEVDGESPMFFVEFSRLLNYRAVDQDGEEYFSSCRVFNEYSNAAQCLVEVENRRLQNLLCDEENYFKLGFYEEENTVDGIPLTLLSPPIPVSRLEPASEEDALSCKRMDTVAEREDEGSGGDPECGDGEILVDGKCVLDGEGGGSGGGGGGGRVEIMCREACATGFVCDTAVGECVPEEPEAGLCDDMECGAGQYCNNETGSCEDFDFGMPTEGTGSGTEVNNQDDNNNEPQPEGINCAFNPSQCSNTKGWCQLNPSAPFNPFVFISLLGLPLMIWFRRTV